MSTLTLRQEFSFEQVVVLLKDVNLLGDSALKPYAKATITTKLVQPNEIKPTSKYVLNGHLETQRYLHWAFHQEHKLDIFDLPQNRLRLLFNLEGESEDWSIIPPIVEESPLDGEVLLVDGEHRFYLARELNVPIKVIWIENVDPRFPVVAKPLSWSEVKAYDEVPSASEKRVFRYPTLSDFPDITKFSDVKITEENFLYFFFRDLSPVCTSGVRRSGSR